MHSLYLLFCRYKATARHRLGGRNATTECAEMHPWPATANLVPAPDHASIGCLCSCSTYSDVQHLVLLLLALQLGLGFGPGATAEPIEHGDRGCVVFFSWRLLFLLSYFFFFILFFILILIFSYVLQRVCCFNLTAQWVASTALLLPWPAVFSLTRWITRCSRGQSA